MLNASLVLKSIGCVVYLSSCLLLQISFSASYCFHIILAKCLIHLKNITREFWKFDYSEIYFLLTEKSMLSVIRGGRKTKDLVGYVKVKLETPLPASR